MARQNGVTTETTKKLLLDAGAVFLNYGLPEEAPLGATKDGSEFTIEQDVRVIEIDGVRGPLKGARRTVDAVIKLTVNLIEVSAENVALALTGSTSAVDGGTGATDITSSVAYDALSYIDNVAIVCDISGSATPVVVQLNNVLSDGDFTLSFTDKEESVLVIQFTAHFDASDLDNLPYVITYPEIV